MSMHQSQIGGVRLSLSEAASHYEHDENAARHLKNWTSYTHKKEANILQAQGPIKIKWNTYHRGHNVSLW